MSEVVIVPGRSDVFEGIEGRAKKFFDTIIEYVEKKRPFLVLICGGETSRDYPGVTEAHHIVNYFWDYFEGKDVETIIDFRDEPITTNEIFRIVERHLGIGWVQRQSGGISQVTVFHEAPAWPKVRLLTWIILKPRGKFRTKVKPVWLGSPWKVWLWQLTVGMADVVFAFIPPLERLEHRLRLKQIAAGK